MHFSKKKIIWTGLPLLLAGGIIYLVASSEQPKLDYRLTDRELPPLAERLPLEPLVVEPYESMGRPGGVWDRAGAPDGLVRILYEPLFRWDRYGQKIRPNLATAFDMREDGRVWTIHLRQGVKWSDGTPFTSEDLVTIYEDITLNNDLRGQGYGFIRDGVPVVIKALDKYTVDISFPNPHRAFLIDLAQGAPLFEPKPRHFIKTFHPDYVEQAKLEAMMKPNGFNNWVQLFNYKLDWGSNPNPREIPSLSAWVPVTAGTDVQRHLAVRNPYYWKVDPQGTQLPYIDVIAHDIVTSPEVMNLMIMAGQVDMQFRRVTLDSYPLYAKNAEAGEYQIYRWKSAVSSQPVLFFNHNHPDPVINKLFNNVKFMQALSLGINRQEINELIYYGLGKPWQAGVTSGSPFFQPQFNRFVEHDTDQANRLLDEIGLDRRDPYGFRLRPDGRPLRLLITHAAPDLTPLELVQSYWAEIGIEVRPHYKAMTWADIEDAQFDILYRAVLDRGMRPDIDPVWLAPLTHWSAIAPKYGRWWENHKLGREEAGVKPPEGSDFERAQVLADQVTSLSFDDPQRNTIMHELLDINARNLWTLGIVGELPEIVIVKNNFRNVPKDAVSDWLLRTPGNTNPEQYWIDEEAPNP